MTDVAAKQPNCTPQRSESTIAALIRARADDDNVGLLYGEQSWTWRQIVAEAAVRAAWLRGTLDPSRPPHLGVLLPNVPEFVFQTFGAALVGACVVGVNPARRGAELARDIEHTECQFVLADAMYADLYPNVIRVEDQPWAGYIGAPLPADDPAPSSPMLLRISGSTSAPKAAVRQSGALRQGCGNRGEPQGRAVLPDAADSRQCADVDAVSGVGRRCETCAAREVLGDSVAQGRSPIWSRFPDRGERSAMCFRPRPANMTATIGCAWCAPRRRPGHYSLRRGRRSAGTGQAKAASCCCRLVSRARLGSPRLEPTSSSSTRPG